MQVCPEVSTKNEHNAGRPPTWQRGLTLIELVVVFIIIGLVMVFVVFRTGTVAYWKQEGFIRQLSETIQFLHHQAVVDQAFYQIEFDLDAQTYQVGVMKADQEADDALKDIAADAGNLTLELAAFLSPSLGEGQSVIPPPSFPSLAVPIKLPTDYIRVGDVRTMRGKISATGRRGPQDQERKAYVMFSPRGFSEFAVVHLMLPNEQAVTILVNPFTGLTDIYRGYKDFKWSYGGGNKDKN